MQSELAVRMQRLRLQARPIPPLPGPTAPEGSTWELKDWVAGLGVGRWFGLHPARVIYVPQLLLRARLLGWSLPAFFGAPWHRHPQTLKPGVAAACASSSLHDFLLAVLAYLDCHFLCGAKHRGHPSALSAVEPISVVGSMLLPSLLPPLLPPLCCRRRCRRSTAASDTAAAATLLPPRCPRCRRRRCRCCGAVRPLASELLLPRRCPCSCWLRARDRIRVQNHIAKPASTFRRAWVRPGGGVLGCTLQPATCPCSRTPSLSILVYISCGNHPRQSSVAHGQKSPYSVLPRSACIVSELK